MLSTRLGIMWGNVSMLFTRLGIIWGGRYRIFPMLGHKKTLSLAPKNNPIMGSCEMTTSQNYPKKEYFVPDNPQ